MSGPSGPGDVHKVFDEALLKRTHYYWTVLGALADYLDAGAIVAGAASLPIWYQYFHLTPFLVALLAALSANSFGSALGALASAPLGDAFGRKTIYTYDLLFYTLGAVLIALANNFVILFIGYLIMGLAVGVDVPVSWSLIAEIAPTRFRSRLMAFINILWYLGPIAVLLIGIATVPLGSESFRVIFGSLAAVALITWALRRSLTESPRWALLTGKLEQVKEAAEKLGINVDVSKLQAAQERLGLRDRLREVWKYKKGIGIGFWANFLWYIPASTFGFFLPYLVTSIAHSNIVIADLVDIGWFATAQSMFIVYMFIADKVGRNVLYGISAAICAVAFLFPTFLPFTIFWVVLLNVLLFGFGHGIGVFPVGTAWQAEVLPTEVRATGQAFVWTFLRTTIGIWSLIVPFIVLLPNGYSYIAGISAALFIVGVVWGFKWGPRTQGKSLEEIRKELYGK